MKEQLFSSCSTEGTLELILDEWSSMELRNKKCTFRGINIFLMEIFSMFLLERIETIYTVVFLDILTGF